MTAMGKTSRPLLTLPAISLIFLFQIVFSQHPRLGPSPRPAFKITGDETLMRPASHESRHSSNGSASSNLTPVPTLCTTCPGDSIGYTAYDFLTGGSSPQNIVNHGDCSLTIARMASRDVVPGWPDRSTWYTHSSDCGDTWPPMVRIQTGRRGWSCIDRFPSYQGAEVIVSHPGSEVMIVVNNTSSTFSPGSICFWPRVASGTGGYVHIVAAQPIFDSPIFYTRFTGLSFSPVDSEFTVPGLVGHTDAYAITAQDSQVVIASAGAGGDVILFRSSDLGDTWTSQTIYDVDESLPDGVMQSQPDGSCSVIFDGSGAVHVAWSNFMAVGTATGTNTLYLSIDAPISYWSEASGLQAIALPTQDSTMDAPTGRDGNFATQPDIGVDGANGVFVIFSQLISERDTFLNNYEHVYGVGSRNGGVSWDQQVDLTPGCGFDASFPSLADRVDSYAHIVFNCDPLAGNSVQGNHPVSQVAVRYLRVPVDVFVNVKNREEDILLGVKLEQNYPNPFNGATQFTFHVPDFGFVSLKVYNVLGQDVATIVEGMQSPGLKSVAWDAKTKSSGVYLYRLQQGGSTLTRKMILMK